MAGCLALFAHRLICEQDFALFSTQVAKLACLVPIALAVQLIKAARQYLLFVDTELSLADGLLYYAQATIVSVIVPYKIGELFRVYRYGSATSDYLGSAARVLVDRLVDTAALLVFLTGMLLLGSYPIFPLYGMLMVFTAVSCAAWLAFPSVFHFWNDYLITRRHSPRAYRALSVMQHAERVYVYIRALLRGKLFIMLLMSLAAWGLELLGVALLAGGSISASIGDYLASALTAGTNEHQRLYVVLYVGVLLCGMLAMLLLGAAKAGKERK